MTKYFSHLLLHKKIWASQVAQWVKNPPAMSETQEMQVQFLGQEDPLEEGMTTYSNILAWRIPWTEEPGGLQSTGSQRVGYDWSHMLACRISIDQKFGNISGG